MKFNYNCNNIFILQFHRWDNVFVGFDIYGFVGVSSRIRIKVKFEIHFTIIQAKSEKRSFCGLIAFDEGRTLPNLLGCL